MIYLQEICKTQTSAEPWLEIEPMLEVGDFKLAHIVQARSKVFLLSRTAQIKQHNVLIELRRRDKVRQFASWMYFRYVGQKYKFDHAGQDFVSPGSIQVSPQDIEQFLIEQVIDQAFKADFTLYYEDLDLSMSLIPPNHYVYPIEQCIKNLDMVQSHLSNWRHHV